jgi:hypothetical protein
MAQGTQRDPLIIASGGLPGLFGTTFSPIPATEGDIAARSRAVVPQFGGAPAQILSTSTFRPTAQAVLPTPLLQRPEEVGRAAFRQIREEAQFPALKPAETIEEIDDRLRSILPVIEQAPPQQPVPGGSGSILEPPTPPPPPSPATEAVAPIIPTSPQPMPAGVTPVEPITAPPERPPASPTTPSPIEPTPAPSSPVPPSWQLTPPPEQPPATPVLPPVESVPSPSEPVPPLQSTPSTPPPVATAPPRPVITLAALPQQTPPPPLMQILQALVGPNTGFDWG